MKFKWPWSKAEEYSGIGRELPTTTDKLGRYVRETKELAKSLKEDAEKLQNVVEELYKQNYNLVKKNQELQKGN